MRASVSRRSVLIGFQFEPRSGVITLGTDAPAAVVDPLLRAYPGIVDYRYDATAGRQSRQRDFAPFAGGAAATDGRSTCTTAFAVQPSGGGTPIMLTAGHCFAPISEVRSPESNARMGLFFRLLSPAFDVGYLDEVRTGATYEASIYRGSAFGQRVRVISGTGPVVGFANYCRSGIITAEQCGMTVTSITAAFCDRFGSCASGLVSYTGAPGTVPTENGDSGAPFYAVAADQSLTNGAYVRGIHVAKVNNIMYAENYAFIRDNFGMTVITR